MKTRCLAFILVLIFHYFPNTGLAARGDKPVGLAELTPISEVYAGMHVLRLDEHKSTATVMLAGKAFKDGIGVEAGSVLIYALKGGYKRLEIKAGIGAGGKEFYAAKTVRFSVCGDGRPLYRGGERRYGDAPAAISVPLEGVQKLELATRGKLVTGSDPRAAFWAEGRLYKAARPAGEVHRASLRVGNAAGTYLDISAFGEEGLLPEEYYFLREFIEETAYPLGADLLITRNEIKVTQNLIPFFRV